MNTFRKIGALSLALVAAFSCGPLEWDNTPYQPDPILPEFQKPKTVVFTANVATKTVLDQTDNTVTWEAGDRVKFVWQDGSKTASASQSGQVTTFEVDIPAVVEELYAVYPAELDVTFADGKLVVDFADMHDGGSFSSSDVSVSRSFTTDGEWNTTLDFKKVASLVKVGVVEENVTSFEIEALGKEGLAGKLELTLDEGTLTCSTPTETSSSINVTVPGPGIYWLPLLPDVELSNGLNVTFYNNDTAVGQSIVSDTKLLARGDIVEFSQPEIFNGKYYVTPAGAGSKSGYSVLNAMDVASFMAFVSNPEKISEFNGKTFRFSANQFSFGDDYLILDYPDNSEVVVTLEGTSNGDKVTEFIGRTNTDEPAKAGVLWPKTNTHLIVKNVKFSKTNGQSNSAAIRINTSSAKLTLEDCLFFENKTLGRGAALAAYKGLIAIKNCTFEGNTSGCGAGLFVDGPATVKVTNSTFKENVANSKADDASAGAIFYAAGDAVLHFTETDFLDNKSVVGGEKAGGVIRLESETAVAYFDRCTFKGNNTARETSKNTASAAIITARVPARYYFNACEFMENTSGTENSTDKYGGKYGVFMAMYSSGTIAMNNCYVHDNYGGRNIDEIQWFFFDHANARLILSNTSVIGDCTRYGYTSPKNKFGVFRFNRPASYHFLNSIVCSEYADGASVLCASQCEVNSLYSKTSPGKDSDTVWNGDLGSGHDYYASTSCFVGWDGYMWNGAMTGTNSDKFAPTSEINSAIESADPDFYTWLNEIGALGKDIDGRDRGNSSWPGCYQAN